ncbi:MAG: FKBP-type peptidyl-prolyl cis-trans isomerase [Bacteroidales bacterium]|nr:FKBP-type peptidyl-prolyl cis-trans isomerase [Bacteroidales bacterium]
MNKTLTTLQTRIAAPLFISAVLFLTSCSGGADRPLKSAPELKNMSDTLSWAYGQNIAAALQQGFFKELDADLVLKSARYALAGGEQPLTDQEVAQAVNYIMAMYSMEGRKETQSLAGDIDIQQENYFKKLLRENPNVKQHSAGFYYEVVRPAKGRKPVYGQRIRFDYRSFLLLSGQPYDQTYGKRDPIIHVVGEPMFPGLIYGLQLMEEGSVYRFYFPYNLAFGASGSGDIPPYTPFIYEVELHEVYDN